MKKLYTIIGISLIICGIGYVVFGRKKEEDVEEPTQENKEEPKETNEEDNDSNEIKHTIQTLVEAGEFNNPGGLVCRIVKKVMEDRDDFAILEKVPKNIEELEVYLKKEGLYEEYEKVLSEKYTKK